MDTYLCSQTEAMDESNILHHLRELSKGIDAIQKRLDSLEASKTSIDLLAAKVSAGFETAEAVLGKIAHALGVKDDAKVGDDEEDRKRLKVRLKEALDGKRPTTGRSALKQEGFLEHYFGICGPDGRSGKHGSRSDRLRDPRRFPACRRRE
jgi:hypothetical protein